MSFFSDFLGGFAELTGDVIGTVVDPFDTGYGDIFKDFGETAGKFAEDYGDNIMLAAGGATLGGAFAAPAAGGGASAGMGSAINVGSIASPAAGGLGTAATVGTGGLGTMGASTAGSVAAPAAGGAAGLLTMDNFNTGMDLLNTADQLNQKQQMQQMQLKSGRGAASYQTQEAPRVEKTYGGLI